jgi:K+-sensing histidine kinase KdpD
MPHPHITGWGTKYAVGVDLYTIGVLLLVGPVLRQRLFDPLSQLNRKLAHRAEQLSIITRVGQQATSFLKLDDLLHVITGEIQRAFGYYAVSMFLPDNSGKTGIVAKAAAGVFAGEFLESDGRRPLVNTSLVGTAAATRQVVNVSNVSQDQRYTPHALRPNTRAEIALPLMVGSASSEAILIGVLDIQSEQTDAFETEAVEVLQILANQIAIAIRNAELFEEAQNARQKADEASWHKTAFLSQMSHELRTPLTTVIGRSQWMLKHPESYGDAVLPDAYVTDLKTIEASSKHLLSLVNDILVLSKIEAGENQMATTLVDPLIVLRNVQEAYIGSLHPGVQIVALYPDRLPYLWG